MNPRAAPSESYSSPAPPPSPAIASQHPRLQTPAAPHTTPLRLLTLFLLLSTLAACTASPTATPPATAPTVQIQYPTPQPYLQTQLYFGLTRRDGSLISEAAWRSFVEHTITPAFPDGFTIITGQGQYLDHAGALHREPARIVVILYPNRPATRPEAKLRALTATYIRDFNQESVLRVDEPAFVSFIERK